MKILILDDDPDVLKFLSKALEMKNFICQTSVNADEAIQNYFSGKFDILITDVHMSPVSGLEVLRIVRNKDQNSKVIILTGYGDLETASIAMQKGAYAFFTKPINLDKLFNALNNLKEVKK